MSDSTSALSNPAGAAAAGLIPWVLAVAASAIALAASDTPSDSFADLGPLVVGYLGFVAVPSVIVLLAARSAALRFAVLVIMSVVAVVAAVPVVASDDAQAGLSILLVLLVSMPLAAVLLVARGVVAIRR